MCPVQSIFYHFNNRDESQIDYFVESVGMVEKYKTFQRESLNTSSHDPMMVVINRKLCMNQNYGGKVHTDCIKWNKDDLNEYEKLVETEMKLKLKQVETLTVSNVNSFVASICDTLVSIAENLQPKRKSNAKRKCKYMWTPEMSNLASQAKHYYWKWKKEGGNNRKSGSYHKMRDIKKCLRSEQRKLEAQKRNNRLTEIMELSETNDKKFYSLVNHQRQQTR
jgi:hypothetical protein